MPKRTNLHQAVIYYVKRHLAGDDAIVTESKLLRDAGSGVEREVDVVVESTVAGHRLVVSIEVTAQRRRMDTTWVEQMIGKHDRMPTDHLVLVSWSGFTGPALTKVEQEGGRVEALTPEIVPNATVPPVFFQEMNSAPEKAMLLVRNDDGTLTKVDNVPILVNLYAAPDHESFVFTLRELVVRTINDRGVGERMTREAYDRKDRDSLTHFSIEQTDLDHVGLHVHDGERFRLLSAFAVTGPISLRYQPVEFTVMKLGDTLFAMTEVIMAGKDAVWVLTPKDDQTATVSWRLV